MQSSCFLRTFVQSSCFLRTFLLSSCFLRTFLLLSSVQQLSKNFNAVQQLSKNFHATQRVPKTFPAVYIVSICYTHTTSSAFLQKYFCFKKGHEWGSNIRPMVLGKWYFQVPVNLLWHSAPNIRSRLSVPATFFSVPGSFSTPEHPLTLLFNFPLFSGGKSNYGEEKAPPPSHGINDGNLQNHQKLGLESINNWPRFLLSIKSRFTSLHTFAFFFCYANVFPDESKPSIFIEYSTQSQILIQANG